MYPRTYGVRLVMLKSKHEERMALVGALWFLLFSCFHSIFLPAMLFPSVSSRGRSSHGIPSKMLY